MVCYKSSFVSYAIAKRIVKLDYISLVNLILQEEVVKELIQQDCSVSKISTELNRLSENKVRKTILAQYRMLENKLGTENASQNVAKKGCGKVIERECLQSRCILLQKVAHALG